METTHNFQLTEEQAMILDQVRKFVQDHAAPQALEHDEHRRFVRDGVEQLAEMGMMGLPVAEESGGAGFGMLALAVALEEIAAACGSTARVLLAQAGMCGKALEGLEAGAQAGAELAAGESLGAWIGPEHGITARPDGEGLALSGWASQATAATEAGTLVVAATDPDGGPLLLVLPADAVPGREALAALGFRASAPGSVTFDGVVAGADAVVARGDDAAAALQRAGLAAAIGGGAIAVGLATGAYEHARRHVHERRAFGKPLFAQQAVRHKLVNSLARTQAARHMVYHAARLADLGDAGAAASAMQARLQAVDAAVYSSDEAIQVHGGYGYVVEYHVERHYRDAMALEALDQPCEALLDGIAETVALG